MATQRYAFENQCRWHVPGTVHGIPPAYVAAILPDRTLLYGNYVYTLAPETGDITLVFVIPQTGVLLVSDLRDT